MFIIDFRFWHTSWSGAVVPHFTCNEIYIVEIKVRDGFVNGKGQKQECAQNYYLNPRIEMGIFSLQVKCGTTAPLHLVCQNRKFIIHNLYVYWKLSHHYYSSLETYTHFQKYYHALLGKEELLRWWFGSLYKINR